MYHKNFPEKNLKQQRNSHEKNPLLCNFEVCIQGDVIGLWQVSRSSVWNIHNVRVQNRQKCLQCNNLCVKGIKSTINTLKVHVGKYM